MCDRLQVRLILSIDLTVALIDGKENFMHDAFSRITANANDNTACLDRADLDEVQTIIAGLNKRLDAVKLISSIASCCVSDAISGIICEEPSLVKPDGPCSSNRMMAACLRDSEIILRYVSYALMAGDASVLDDRCLKGLKETYTALNVSIPPMIRAITLMKTICVSHILNAKSKVVAGDCSDLASECATYFEHVIAAIR